MGNGTIDKPCGEEGELGLMAMTFNKDLGWIAETLGPKSGHCKRLARVAHSKEKGEEISPKNNKRESSVPIQELDVKEIEDKIP